jgi:hypothetical protein
VVVGRYPCVEFEPVEYCFRGGVFPLLLNFELGSF